MTQESGGRTLRGAASRPGRAAAAALLGLLCAAGAARSEDPAPRPAWSVQWHRYCEEPPGAAGATYCLSAGADRVVTLTTADNPAGMALYAGVSPADGRELWRSAHFPLQYLIFPRDDIRQRFALASGDRLLHVENGLSDDKRSARQVLVLHDAKNGKEVARLKVNELAQSRAAEKGFFICAAREPEDRVSLHYVDANGKVAWTFGPPAQAGPVRRPGQPAVTTFVRWRLMGFASAGKYVVAVAEEAGEHKFQWAETAAGRFRETEFAGGEPVQGRGGADNDLWLWTDAKGEPHTLMRTDAELLIVAVKSGKVLGAMPPGRVLSADRDAIVLDGQAERQAGVIAVFDPATGRERGRTGRGVRPTPDLRLSSGALVVLDQAASGSGLLLKRIALADGRVLAEKALSDRPGHYLAAATDALVLLWQAGQPVKLLALNAATLEPAADPLDVAGELRTRTGHDETILGAAVSMRPTGPADFVVSGLGRGMLSLHLSGGTPAAAPPPPVPDELPPPTPDPDGR